MKKKELENKEEVVEETTEETPEETPEEDNVVEEVKSILNDRVKMAVNELKGEVKGDLEEQMKAYVAEQKEVSETKSGLYHQDVKASRKALSEKVRGHIKVALGQKATIDGMSTSEDEYGGYTVDEELDAEVRALTQEFGVARREMFVTPLSKGAYNVNHLVSDIASSWIDEGGAFETNRVELGTKKLELKKLGVIVALSNELLSDSEVDLTRFVTERVAQEFAYREDRAGFVGAGASADGGFTGILAEVVSDNRHTLDAGKDEFTDIKISDILDARDKIKGDNLDIKVYLNRELKSHLRKETDDNGRYLINIEDGVEKLWGMPLVEVDVMPDMSDSGASTDAILVGDLKKACIMGYKGGFVIDEFTTGSIQIEDYTGSNENNVSEYINLLTSDRKAVRFKERVGFVNVLTNAVAVVRTGEST